MTAVYVFPIEAEPHFIVSHCTVISSKPKILQATVRERPVTATKFSTLITEPNQAKSSVVSEWTYPLHNRVQNGLGIPEEVITFIITPFIT